MGFKLWSMVLCKDYDMLPPCGVSDGLSPHSALLKKFLKKIA